MCSATRSGHVKWRPRNLTLSTRSTPSPYTRRGVCSVFLDILQSIMNSLILLVFRIRLLSKHHCGWEDNSAPPAEGDTVSLLLDESKSAKKLFKVSGRVGSQLTCWLLCLQSVILLMHRHIFCGKVNFTLTEFQLAEISLSRWFKDMIRSAIQSATGIFTERC